MIQVGNYLTIIYWNSYAIAALPEDYQQNGKAEFIRLSEELTSAGYKVKDTTVGDKGLKVERLNDN